MHQAEAWRTKPLTGASPGCTWFDPAAPKHSSMYYITGLYQSHSLCQYKRLSVCFFFASVCVCARAQESMCVCVCVCVCVTASLQACVCVLPWYNCTGWLGVKHQVTYLSCECMCTRKCMCACITISHNYSPWYTVSDPLNLNAVPLWDFSIQTCTSMPTPLPPLLLKCNEHSLSVPLQPTPDSPAAKPCRSWQPRTGSHLPSLLPVLSVGLLHCSPLSSAWQPKDMQQYEWGPFLNNLSGRGG